MATNTSPSLVVQMVDELSNALGSKVDDNDRIQALDKYVW